MCSVNNDAVPAEDDETQSHMKPVVLETLNVARYCTHRVISPQRLTLETSNFVHGSAMQSLSLVMSECFLCGRGQGHVSNFYIVYLEISATTSRRYTGDVHNSTVVSLFMTHCLQLNLQLHIIGFVRTCRISIFCTVAW